MVSSAHPPFLVQKVAVGVDKQDRVHMRVCRVQVPYPYLVQEGIRLSPYPAQVVAYPDTTARSGADRREAGSPVHQAPEEQSLERAVDEEPCQVHRAPEVHW